MSNAGGDTDEYGSPAQSEWVTTDWRQHQRWVRADGAQVNVVEFGVENGPPALLVHGHDGSWRNWLETIPQLGRTHRVIAFDLPGFGESPPLADVTLGGYVRVIACLCDELELRRPAVFGSSMGGLLACELALARPELPDRLVLVSAAGLSDRYMRLPRAVLAHPLAPLAALTRLSRRSRERARFMARRARLRRAGLGMVVRHPDRISPEIAAILLAAGGRPGSAPAAAAVARHRGDPLRLTRITCPVLIVWGQQDTVVAVAAAVRFAELIPNSRLEIFADTGHLPMLERPARFNALVRGFLNSGRSAT